MSDVIDNPLSYLTGTIFLTTLDLNLMCTDVGIKRGIDSLADKGTLLIQAKVFQQHSSREDLRQGVSQILSCSLWP